QALLDGFEGAAEGGERLVSAEFASLGKQRLVAGLPEMINQGRRRVDTKLLRPFVRARCKAIRRAEADGPGLVMLEGSERDRGDAQGSADQSRPLAHSLDALDRVADLIERQVPVSSGGVVDALPLDGHRNVAGIAKLAADVDGLVEEVQRSLGIVV